jgi:imidazolonepropionase-like amidohydrolase
MLGATALATALCAQEGGAGKPWRGAGTPPCFGPEGGTNKCVPAPGTVAIRAGQLFDSKTGQMASRQIVLMQGERITEVGPEAQIKIPAGAQVIDLSQATVLPGMIDAHTHMFNNPKPGMSRETSTLIALQNLQADLSAGFTAASISATPSTKAASTGPAFGSRAAASCGAPLRPLHRQTR